MTAATFASLLKARRVSRGKWSALCPVHGDHKRSLSIAEGKRTPIVFKCMSQGCTPASILDAMGLTWKDVLGDRVVTPEIRQRLLDQERLRILNVRWGALTFLKFGDPENLAYWNACRRNLDAEIMALKRKMDPQLDREIRMKAAIQRHGWDVIWEKFLLTEKGQEVSRRYSIDSASSTPLNAPLMPKEVEFVSK